MQENSRYAVGIDIGTTMVRCVVGHIDNASGALTVVGVGKSKNSGMRKGIVVNLDSPAQAIDDALGEAERMSGCEIDSATISINGSHILSTHTDGMIAVGGSDHEIDQDDIYRIKDVATVGKVPANRKVIEIIPHSYKLDGQGNIKNPIGMTGTRLEIDAHVVSALAPYYVNLQKTTEVANVRPNDIIVAGVASSKAVLTEQQLENGVCVLDIGGSTTGIVVYEEGDLQFTSVLTVGGVNITNDLAIGLKTDPEIAEMVKLNYQNDDIKSDNGIILIEHNSQGYEFAIDEINEIIEARLDELFEKVNKELKKAGRAGKLPGGVVIVGGTANLKGIADCAKEALGLAVKIGKPAGLGGVADGIDTPEFATAVGLMLADSEAKSSTEQSVKNKGKNQFSKGAGVLSKMINRFRA